MGTKSHKKLGAFFIASPFIGLLLWGIIMFFSPTTTDELAESSMGIFDYIIGAVGILDGIAMFILLPVGIYLVVKSKPESAQTTQQPLPPQTPPQQ